MANDTSIISEMLQPLGSLTRQAASEIAEIRVPETVQDRVAELADKHNQGTISDEELAEYEQYVRVGNVLSVIKAKAKKVLADRD